MEVFSGRAHARFLLNPVGIALKRRFDGGRNEFEFQPLARGLHVNGASKLSRQFPSSMSDPGDTFVVVGRVVVE